MWALALARCGAPAPPLNVLLITLDTTRTDHLSAYGYARDTSPRLAELAAEGVRFDAAYAPTATTAPSHASLFTAAMPPLHGVLKNGIPLSAELPTLAEEFAAAGYDTAAVVSSFVLTSRFGLSRGFSHFDDAFEARESSGGGNSFVWEGERVFEVFDRRGDYTTRRAARWLAENRDPERPFFLFVHYFDPHDPYAAPGHFANRFAPDDDSELTREIARYDSEIAFVDRQVGALLDSLERTGLRDDTLVVVTADHGEGLLDHGHMAHGAQLYEESVRVPLLVRWPHGVTPGVIDTPVSIVDVGPAILELAGVGSHLADDGAAAHLAASMRGTAEPRAAPIFFYRRPYAGDASDGPRGEKFGMRDGRWKYIDGPAEGRRELYDLVADPGERTDALATRQDVATRLAAQLELWRGEHPPRGPAGRVDATDRERLRTLGYVE